MRRRAFQRRAIFGDRVDIGLDLVRLRRRDVFAGRHVVAGALGRARHREIHLRVVFVFDRDHFQAPRFHAGLEALDYAPEQQLFDESLPRFAELGVEVAHCPSVEVGAKVREFFQILVTQGQDLAEPR